jgi:hypothetical protein
MNPQIGNLDHPVGKVNSKFLERGERSTCKGIMLDVANAPFDLALGTGAPWAAGLRYQAAVSAKCLESWVPNHFAGLAIVRGHQWRGVIAEDLLSEAAEMLEGPLQALQPVVLPLSEEGSAKEPPRVAEHRRHEVNLD